MKRPSLPTLLTLTLCGLFATRVAVAQDGSPVRARDSRPIAITHARILTMAGKAIADGTVLIRNGKIAAVGTDIEIPAGARIVSARGGTVMPGLVSAWSRAGLQSRRGQRQSSSFRRRGRRFRGRPRSGGASTAKNRAAAKVIKGLYPRQKIFGKLLGAGVTTLALTPASASAAGFPGLGAIVNPAGKTLTELTRNDAAFGVVYPVLGTKARKLLADSLEKAKKLVEARKKPKETKKPAAKKPEAKKPQPKKTETKKPESKKPGAKPAPKKPAKKAPAKETAKKAAAKKTPPAKDPNLEALADLLEGKQRTFLQLSTANDLVHYLATVKELRFAKTVVVAPSLSGSAGRLDQVMKKLKTLKAPVLMPPELTSPPYRQTVINPAAILHRAGIEIGFLIPDNQHQIDDLFFKLIELVRTGLPHDVALAAITSVPARMLGIADKVGTIGKGKQADLLLFSGDPLDPTSKLLEVWHDGVAVTPPEEGTR